MSELPRGSRKLTHGTPCYCGTCGATGIWDSRDPKISDFKDAIWYNPNLPADEDGLAGGIECYECWLK